MRSALHEQTIAKTDAMREAKREEKELEQAQIQYTITQDEQVKLREEKKTQERRKNA